MTYYVHVELIFSPNQDGNVTNILSKPIFLFLTHRKIKLYSYCRLLLWYHLQKHLYMCLCLYLLFFSFENAKTKRQTNKVEVTDEKKNRMKTGRN